MNSLCQERPPGSAVFEKFLNLVVIPKEFKYQSIRSIFKEQPKL